MTRVAAALAAALLVVASASLAQADPSEYSFVGASASASTSQAGGHPDFNSFFELKTEGGQGKQLPSTTSRFLLELPPGLLGNANAVPKCTAAQLVNTDPEEKSNETGCPQDSQIGVTQVRLFKNGQLLSFLEPIFNMKPRSGEPARLGVFAEVYPVFIDTELRSGGPNPDYGATAFIEGVSSFVPLLSAETTIWGVPADESHDGQRLTPYEAVHSGHPETENGKRPSSLAPVPFMLNPTRCGIAQELRIAAVPYVQATPGFVATASAPIPPNTGCELLDFKPDLKITPTTSEAETGSGLDVELTFPTDGLEHQNVPGEAEQKKVEVTLPEGLTVNPSQAEGLDACSEEQFRKETSVGAPNEGCPEASKIGSVTASSPLIDEPAEGALYVAKPYENPFGGLVAVYMVVRIPERGVAVKLAGKVELDPNTGQVISTFDNIPQLPVASFRLHFREGARSPLVTPRDCGSYRSTAVFTSWSGQVVTTHPSFEINRGVNGAACPSTGSPPLHPKLTAGTINNAAGKYSPFYLRLSRQDGEQQISRFSIKLPRGLTGRLAGIPFCSDAAITAATARTGPHGGQEEIEHPSCPAASAIGHTLAGAGVGPVLAYAPGEVYLAGPFHGSLLSIVAITAGKIGPFDVGTIVIREALKVDPETAEVFIDAAGSSPLPQIIKGVPTHLRDIRAYMSRPQFVLNPTGCQRKTTSALVLGAGGDLASGADDQLVTASAPFQASDCSALPFKPKLSLRLRGGTHRGAHPSFTGTLRMKPGEAAIARTQVTLPHSEFIENAHFQTICTRVQFVAGKVPGEACPAGSIYGHVEARTPLLSEPLSGPVYLRSSSHELPDMVIALNGKEINIDAAARIDSTRGGGIRATFEHLPDAPVSRVVIHMRGAKKGLIVNSTNICRGIHRAEVKLRGQNGKARQLGPELKATCK